MAINYQNSSLNLLYNGRCYEILKGNLKEIDNITINQLSKFLLLRKLITEESIDRELRDLLSKISDDLPVDYLLDDEYKNFDFFIVTKDSSKKIILPVLYGQYSFKSERMAAELQVDENLLSILKTYNKGFETDPDNQSIIHDIISFQRAIIKSSLMEELLIYNDLEAQVQNGTWLEEKNYKYYKDLKVQIMNLRSRNDLIQKLINNIQSSHYKKRSLCIIKKFYNGELSEFSSSIVQATDNNYDILKNTILDTEKIIKK